MEKRLFRISLLVITFGLIWFSSVSGVLSLNATAIGDSEWRLLVDGSVYHPLNLTLNDLVAMPRSTEYAELWCVTGAETWLVTKGNWTGVKLGLVLEKAGLYPQAESVEFYAADGYRTTLTVAMAFREDVIIAYEKDGEPLPETLRLVVPEAPGYYWISMITHIELVESGFNGLRIENNGPVFAHEGDTLKYFVVVTNLDNSPINYVTVKDEIGLVRWGGGLAARESKVFNIEYIIPVGAKDPLTNKVTAFTPVDPSPSYAEDTWNVDVLHPKLEVSRTVEPTEVYAGDSVTHTIVITNTGDTTLFNLTLVDSIYGNAPRDTVPSSLEPRESFVWSFNAPVNETVENVATSTGVDALGLKVSDSDKSVVEVKSNKTDAEADVSEITEEPFNPYALYVIATAATATTVIACIITIRKRRR